MKFIKNHGFLISLLMSAPIALSLSYFMATPSESKKEVVHINQTLITGEERCQSWMLPKNRLNIHISGSRGGYSLSYTVPTKMGLKAEKHIRNAVIDYQIVEKCP